MADSQHQADERIYKIEEHFRGRLAESERIKERYLRYAVAIAERLKGCADQISKAHSSALELAASEEAKQEENMDEEMRQLIGKTYNAMGLDESAAEEK